MAGEGLDSGDAGQLGPVERTRAHGDEPGADRVAAVGADDPARRGRIPLELGDRGREQRVVVEVERLGDAPAVLEDLGRHDVLRRRHVAGLFQQRQVDHGRGVAHRARVAVPVPRAAEVAADLDDPHVVDARLLQPRAHAQPREAATDQRDGHVVEPRLALDPLGVGIVEHRGEPARRLEVLVVAVGPQPLVALLAVLDPQRVVIDRRLEAVTLRTTETVAGPPRRGWRRQRGPLVRSARARLCGTNCGRYAAVAPGWVVSWFASSPRRDATSRPATCRRRRSKRLARLPRRARRPPRASRTFVADVARRGAMAELPRARGERAPARTTSICCSTTPASAAAAASSSKTATSGTRRFAVCWGGVYLGCRTFLPMLIAADDAHIVNTSSVNGFWASLGPAHSAHRVQRGEVRGEGLHRSAHHRLCGSTRRTYGRRW